MRLSIAGGPLNLSLEELYRQAQRTRLGDDHRIQHRLLQPNWFELRSSRKSKVTYTRLLAKDGVSAGYFFEFDSSLESVLEPVIERMNQSFRFF